jgi:4-alpha-glucanotransferase
MGLWRLWWIPDGAPAGAGCYVRYPDEELLDILALESVRAGAFVVGEDLGTVPPGVREELARRSILRSAVGLFEDEPPGAWPPLAVGSISTHDLPTLEGLRTGADASARRRAGLAVDEAADARARARLGAWLPDFGLDATGRPGATAEPPETDEHGVDGEPGATAEPRTTEERRGGSAALSPVDAGAVALHRVLGASPCRVVVASLEDVLGVAERPNMPGTTDSWPNWSLALPRPLEELVEDPRAVAVLRALRAGRALSGG